MCKYPTWKDVSIPESFLAKIRESSYSSILLEKIVFHQPIRRVSHQYTCKACGASKVVQRPNDDYSICSKCSSPFICSIPMLIDCESDCYKTDAVMKKMFDNYKMYFGEEVSDFVKFDLKNFYFEIQFKSGEVSIGSDVTRTLEKAALLVPFLWDNKFNWKTGTKDAGYNFTIIDIISEMAE